MNPFHLPLTSKNPISLFVITALILLFTLLSACVNKQVTLAQNSNGSGFGGTGHAFQPEQGFGGTGHQRGFGGTGIIGTISAFGSIWVNGVEIEYDENTPIATPLNDKKHPLKLGQQVVVETKSNSDEPLAKQIRVFIPIAGKIQQRDGDWLTIGSEKDHILGQTHIDKALDIQAGNYVAINGYRTTEHQWEATRINANPQHKQWVKTQLPIHLSENVRALIIDPKLLPMISSFKTNTELLQTLKNQQHTTKNVLWIEGKMHDQHFQPRRVFPMEMKASPKGHMIIDRPHPRMEGKMPAHQWLMERGNMSWDTHENAQPLQQQMPNWQPIRESMEQQESMQQQKQSMEQMQEVHQQMNNNRENQQQMQNLQEMKDMNDQPNRRNWR